MATKYIESVASATARSNAIPNVPGKAGLVYRTDTGQLDVRDPVSGTAIPFPGSTTSVQTLRSRQAIAAVNAGVSLLPAIPGFKYRMVSASAIAVGGAAGAVTTVDILGTQATASVKLVAFAQASLLQSAQLKSGNSGAAILADGASYAECDANTAITANITGSAITTATSIDFEFSYVLVAA